MFAEAGHEPVVGREAIVAHFTKFFRDGPAFRLFVTDAICEGERCAVFYTFELHKDEAWVRRDGIAQVHVTGGLVALWKEYQ